MLTQLVCLRAQQISAPDGVIGRLTSLEELHIGGPRNNDESQRQFVKDLGHLRELRVLKINSGYNIIVMDEGMQTDLVQSTGNLQKMQHLTLGDIVAVNMNARYAAVPSRDLRCLFLPHIWFPKLLSWINSAHLPSLFHLEIHVDDLDEQGLIALGGLPELYYLSLRTYTGPTITSNNTEADVCFQKLRSLVLPDSMVQVVANEDSSASFTIWNMFEKVPAIGRKRNKDNCRAVCAVFMPNLEDLEFGVSVKENVSCEDLGLEYLPSIRKVKVEFWCSDAFEDEVERQEAALRHAIEVHPNRPTLQIEYSLKKCMKRRSDGDGPIQPRNEEDGEESRVVVAT